MSAAHGRGLVVQHFVAGVLSFHFIQAFFADLFGKSL